MAAAGHFSRPPGGIFVAVPGQLLVVVVRVTVASTDAVARHVAADEPEHRAAPGTPLHILTTSSPTATTSLFVQYLTSEEAGPLRFRSGAGRTRRG
jgi:hypothetical protein